MEEKREEFIQRKLAKEKNLSALCREYGISRPTGYKWLKRHSDGAGMKDRSRAPNSSPRRISADIEKLIVAERKEHPAQGATKIKRMLEERGHGRLPAHSTINEIFHRNGLITPEASSASTPYNRFVKERPNEMWQMDFKGFLFFNNREKVHPLAVIDDNSRYNLCLDSKKNEQYVGVRESLERVFHEYGLPESILCDNGNPWGNAMRFGYTKLEVWLLELGIMPKHIRAWHPQTQGKTERFNRTLKDELLKFITLTDFDRLQQEFDRFRDFYNNVRPHNALKLATPASKYRVSERKMPEKITEWEYPAGSFVRQITQRGCLCYKGTTYFISNGLHGKVIRVQESEAPWVLDVIFRDFRLAKVNIREHKVFAQHPVRLYGENSCSR